MTELGHTWDTSPRKPDRWSAHSPLRRNAGGGTRTPDTRIMIPLL
jgi:hypothetical protein